MLTRRDFMQIAAATAVMTARPGNLAAATKNLSQDDLLEFDTVGQVTLLNFTDCHAQLTPLYFREPSINIGVGDVNGLPPHLTGKEALKHFGLQGGSPAGHAFSMDDFTALARQYGRIGGIDRMATLIKAIRAERPANTLLLDGGDTWQGSYTSLKTKGADMVRVMNALGVDTMTGHWEFTYGQDRVQELVESLDFAFLAGNVKDKTWDDDIFEHTKTFERGGVNIAVIGQAFPYTPIANPRYMMADWSFGIEEEKLQERVDAAREAGADLIVVNSHNGFDVDRKLAGRVKGIDVLLTGHTHDAIPRPIKVGNTILVASGSHGKFLARLDLKVEGKRVVDFRFKLMPIFSDVIKPDAEMAALITDIQKPYRGELDKVLGRTESLLYRRGNFNGTFDDLICDALLEERDAEIALSPGFRWGATLLPGDDIRAETVYSQTAITYPNVYRQEFTGAFLKEILEDVADNLFNPDPYLQQGGDMVRVGGMGYAIDINKPIGSRISDMTMLKSGDRVDPARNYTVAGWASVNEGTEGPPVYDLVNKYITDKKVIRLEQNRSVKVRNG